MQPPKDNKEYESLCTGGEGEEEEEEEVEVQVVSGGP